MGAVMTVGQAARASDLTPKAVRLYERRGLLPRPARSPAGYRLFTADDVARLTFIRQARTLGLGLEDIAQVVTAAGDGSRPCPTVRALLDRRIAGIGRTIAELTALRASLTAARTLDDRGPARVCPLIEAARR